MKARAKVWLEHNGAMVFGGGRTDLLRRIETTGSINRAAADLGMSYRRALARIQQMEAGLGTTLVERHAGGLRGGGSHLTPVAHDLLHRFEALEHDLDDIVRARFEDLFAAGTRA